MKVGLLTTWNTRCGIAEYSRYFAEALWRQEGVEVTVLGSRNFGDRAVRDYEGWASPVFDVGPWTPDFDYALDWQEVLALELDVLHVQYSNLFYHRRSLVRLLSRFPGLVALTFHDNVVSRTTFPTRLVDVAYTHRDDIGVGRRRTVPLGIDVHVPVVKTFGLGKSRADVINGICERNGWHFESSYGERRWLDAPELRDWLRDSDAIVLWYEEDPTAGESAAAALAISTRRPVFLNDTSWVRGVPERTASALKVRDPEHLERALHDQFADAYAAERSWDKVAASTVADYRSLLAQGAPVELGNGQHRRHDWRAPLYAAGDPKPLIARKRRLLRQTPRHRAGDEASIKSSTANEA